MMGKKILERRKKLAITQQQLSDITGIKTTTISHYENGITYPNEENLMLLMKALRCDANYLFSWGEMETISLSEIEKISVKKYRTLDEYGKEAVDDLLSTEYRRCKEIRQLQKPEIIHIKMSEFSASAGAGIELGDESYETIAVKASEITRQADFAVRVSGDSMQPTFYDGDVILVESMPQINIGDIGVFIVDGDGFVKELGEGKLISHNEKYPDIYLRHYDMAFCSGKVIGVLAEDDFV